MIENSLELEENKDKMYKEKYRIYNAEDITIVDDIAYLKFDMSLINTGKAVSHWEDGKLKSELIFKDGKKDGACREWHENGQKKAEVNFKNGKQDGLSTKWNKNGQKEYEWNYKKGKRDGVATAWDKNGQINTKLIWKNGAIISVSIKNGEEQGEVKHNN